MFLFRIYCDRMFYISHCLCYITTPWCLWPVSPHKYICVSKTWIVSENKINYTSDTKFKWNSPQSPEWPNMAFHPQMFITEAAVNTEIFEDYLIHKNLWTTNFLWNFLMASVYYKYFKSEQHLFKIEFIMDWLAYLMFIVLAAILDVFWGCQIQTWVLHFTPYHVALAPDFVQKLIKYYNSFA